MDEGQKAEPKLQAPAIVFGFIVVIIFDLLGLIPFVSDLLDVAWGTITFILGIFGVGGMFATITNIIAFVAELIPGVQELPFYTIAWTINVIADRSQKVKKVVETVGTVTPAAKGGAARGGAGKGGVGGTAATTKGAMGKTATEEIEGKVIIKGGGSPEEKAVAPEKEATKKEFPKEALGEKPEIMEALPKKLLQEFPDIEESEEKDEGLEEAA